MMTKPDIRVQDEGTIFVLYPLTDAANDWMQDNMHCDSNNFWCDGMVVEHRYVASILRGMVRGGLILS
jgi:hypothetical protein